MDPIEQIAVMLADPLRQAWVVHMESHPKLCKAHHTYDHCGFTGTPCPTSQCGTVNCPEAMRLFGLLPRGDQLTILSGVA